MTVSTDPPVTDPPDAQMMAMINTEVDPDYVLKKGAVCATHG